jgi:hypothetical protein
MLDDETDEAVEPTAEDTSADSDADAGADDGAAAEDAQAADAMDAQATPGGAGETVLKQPEVPDDANDKIAAAQAHINNLNMDEERDAAERAAKKL